MHGGGGVGGESYTNFSTGRAGTPYSSADHGPAARPAQVAGVGSTAVLVVGGLLLLVFVVALMVL